MNETAITLLVRAHLELNEIRARDGVPYTHYGMKSSVDPQSFSDLIEDINAFVQRETGHSAHCHPLLYRNRGMSQPLSNT